MLKYIKKSLILFAFLALLLCLLFPMPSFSDAAIEGISGNNIILTGYIGNSPKHFFEDENKKSTLENCETKAVKGEYYSIVSSGRGTSSGWAEFRPTNDMKPFIEKGLLYAKASAEVDGKGSTSVTLQISSGDQSKETSAISGEIATPLIQIKELDKNIRFSFSTASSSKNDFTISLPTIHIYTQINSVTLSGQDQTVSPGQLIKINAFNDVTEISGTSGNFMNFSKINHEIKFEFVSGGEYATVVGTNLSISTSAKDGTKIKFRVYSNQNSYSDSKIYSSNYLTLTVDTNNVSVKVRTDFENPATFVGEGLYKPGKRFTLTASSNPNFQFEGWYVNGEFKSKDKLIAVATAGQDIYAKFIKKIDVKQIIVPDKIYDKTTNIDQSRVSVLFDGLEKGHELTLLGAKFSFGDPNAGENKLIVAQYDNLTLSGKNADIYALKTQILPNSYGKIQKRDALVIPEASQKQYGYTDPQLSFKTQNLVDGDALVGNLGRRAGEKIGLYEFEMGDLERRNPNYNIIIDGSNSFEITKRELYLENVSVKDKIYDKTTTAEVTANLKNIYNSESVSVELTAEFVSAEVDNDIEVILTSATLQGKDKGNYVLKEFTQKIFGKIVPRPILVKALSCTAIYGDEISFDYIISGLLGDDKTDVQLAIENKAAGKHAIQFKSLTNSNYSLGNFESAICTISPRDITVSADPIVKAYGDGDPELTYIAQNLMEGDSLQGSLQRIDGEDVGEYEIRVGDLQNPNYNIIFIKNNLTIVRREIFVIIEFLDREYDGTLDANYSVRYENNIKNDEFSVNIDANLSSKDCGIVSALIINKEAQFDGKPNYYFTFQIKKSEVRILRRNVNVTVDEKSKIYGENDPQFTFTASNLVENESLQLNLQRIQGETVGFYKHYIQNNYLELNPNYNITLIDSSFQILPKPMSVAINTQSKIFGDNDPEINFEILDQFCFEDSEEDIIDGQVLRERGENVGIYNFDLSLFSSSKNYVFESSSDSYFIIEKRPVVVTIESATKVYGEEDPHFNYSVSNEVKGEKLNAEITRDYGEDVGDYDLVCKTNNDSRYTITFVGAVLKITPYAIKIKADKKVKIYGDEDPVFSVSITGGHLKNNDSMENIISGSLVRNEGEDVGEYQINLGTLSFGGNYSLTFESENLTILQRHLTITATEARKIYGESDPEFNFQILDDLAFNDVIEGKPSRERGENAGKYKILQGNISLSDNYQFDFVSADFEIIKKQIEIVPTKLSKEYGDKDEEITYEIVDGLIGQDELSGKLYRDEKSENIGKYLIYSSLTNPNYQINFGEYYFTILPREIVLKARDCQIYYGQSEPKLEFDIISGSILEGDRWTGELSRIKGDSVGEYDIISTLSLGRNYTVEYVKGVLTILPLELTISCPNFQKIYGQEDPSFTYEIVSGELINGDKLYGSIIREAGEDVGVYNLEKGIYNANYNITFLPAKLEILKKDVYMISTVYNKIYDGTTVAQLKNPYISGIIDNVYLDFDKDNCATFESAEAGKNIAVKVHNISLTGAKAGNYNLILPETLYADITLQSLSNKEVIVSAKDPVLYADYFLAVSSESLDHIKIENHNLMLKYDIYLEKESNQFNPNSQYTIKIGLPKSIFSKYNIYVYQKNENGEYELLTSKKNAGNEMVISAHSLGEFYITIEDESWLDIGAFVSIGVITLSCIVAFSYTLLKKKKKKRMIEGD